MKRLFVCVMIALAAAGLSAQDARQSPGGDALSIVKASRDRIGAATTQSRSRMVITAKSGSTTERLIDQFSKDGPKGSRSVVVFQQPESVKNTRFLTMETGTGTNDQWIYLPSLNKVRRLAASEGSGSFVGTDLSYDDVASTNRGADLDNHAILREETINGKACYVIESVPKNSSYQYSKMVQWIGKDDKVNYKVELYDKRGTHIKTLETLELRNVQGKLSIVRSRMSTLKAGTNTAITVEALRYDEPLAETVFTTEFLEKGKL